MPFLVRQRVVQRLDSEFLIVQVLVPGNIYSFSLDVIFYWKLGIDTLSSDVVTRSFGLLPARFYSPFPLYRASGNWPC